MASAVRYRNPAGLLDGRRFGFSQISVTGAGALAHIAGQTAADERGHVDPADDLGAQTRKALNNLGIALQSVGASPAALVALRVYIVDLDPSMFGPVSDEIARFLSGAEPPPATWIGVGSLLARHALIEIEASAATDVS